VPTAPEYRSAISSDEVALFFVGLFWKNIHQAELAQI
jgi:hypothetical protein